MLIDKVDFCLFQDKGSKIGYENLRAEDLLCSDACNRIPPTIASSTRSKYRLNRLLVFGDPAQKIRSMPMDGTNHTDVLGVFHNLDVFSIDFKAFGQILVYRIKSL